LSRLPPKAKKAPCGAFFAGCVSLHPVDQDIQAQPHHVDEVPVPGGAFESEMALGGEVPFIRRSVMNSSISMPTNTWKPWKPVSMKKVEP
jgi:hypothetical protein